MKDTKKTTKRHPVRPTRRARSETAPPRPRSFSTSRSIEVAAPVEEIFALWCRFEELPRHTENVRRVKQISDRHVLFEVDVAGRQLVWEGVLVESVRDQLLRWESVWGAKNHGEVRFEALAPQRSRLTVTIHFEPGNVIERLGARLGIPGFHVRRDLVRFRDVVEARFESGVISHAAGPATPRDPSRPEPWTARVGSRTGGCMFYERRRSRSPSSEIGVHREHIPLHPSRHRGGLLRPTLHPRRAPRARRSDGGLGDEHVRVCAEGRPTPS